MSERRVQKNLTVMFTDISGFTKHTETISREALMARLDTHNELLMPIVAHFDGKIVKTIGDAFLITFESPTNAVHCGLYIQHTLREYNREKADDDQIHVKVSINSGEVTVTEHDVFGDPVNVAAKIEKATNPDEIYFTESVFLAMNKAEVPTSFVKAFRPKGVDSTEIKLYRVAMDEDDERYQRVVSSTHIDKEQVKTRVLELSSLAEREFVRYQDALESLVDRQGKSSRRLLIAVIAGTLILGAAVVVGFSLIDKGAGDDPAATLGKDVRAYLQLGKWEEARDRVNTYVQAEGADETTNALIEEIRRYEIRQLEARASDLIARGQPEDARQAITSFFGTSEPPATTQEVLAQADAVVNARESLAKGDPQSAVEALSAVFGETSPSKLIAELRRQAGALADAKTLLDGPRRYEEPLRAVATVVAEFGDDTKNEFALAYIDEALADEMYRAAKARGYDAAVVDYEAYRKRFVHLPSWRWVEAQLHMGALWEYRTKSLRSRWSHSEAYWEKWRQVRDAVADKPEQAYRFGCFQFLLARATSQGTCDGAASWKLALATDPTLRHRHAALGACYRGAPRGDRAKLGQDLKTDLTYMLGCFAGGLADMRDLVATYYYDDLRDTLIAYADSTDKTLETEQMNALAILAQKGDAALIGSPLAVFRAQLDTLVTGGDRLTRDHSRALFAAPMSYADYEGIAEQLDILLREVSNREGRFGNHRDAHAVLDAMHKDLRKAQPEHTIEFDNR